MWQKDDRIRKSPLKFYVYYNSDLSGDCQASIFTELWRLSVAFCVTLWHMSIRFGLVTMWWGQQNSNLRPDPLEAVYRRTGQKTNKPEPLGSDLFQCGSDNRTPICGLTRWRRCTAEQDRKPTSPNLSVRACFNVVETTELESVTFRV